jgi:hypothetical protein
MDNSFSSFSDILKKKQAEAKKAPAYPWQDLALQVIKDLNIPNFKRSAVFKICKENDERIVRLAVNDTKELCQNGAAWKYFFKIIDNKKNEQEKDSKNFGNPKIS